VNPSSGPEPGAIERLRALPRAPLGTWPTPLHRLDRFSEAVGHEVWAKRDDIGSVGLAGNKVRKFELVLGEAVRAGADLLVTTGAAQSNSARTGAAAAAALGMGCVLVLAGDEPSAATANLLLGRLFGAETRFLGDVGWEALNRGVDDVAAEASAAGRRPVRAPVGCSSPLGSLGFALGYLELVEQLDGLGLEPGVVVHASTSGGTDAGLVAGRHLLGRGPGTRAFDAGLVFADPAAGVAALASEALAIVGCPHVIAATDVAIDVSQVGGAYGRPTAAATAAIDLLARTEGILCDPVYSGKALAGLVADARSGRLPAGAPAVFWHTGGWHALFEPGYAANQLGLA
jgi:1-aminocyclopropane-1-carboxylate deaminase/D-cysteine desulfhydrase-like pyridoxal-dependent ACC family enzyme